jgi:hypothetical protein
LDATAPAPKLNVTNPDVPTPAAESLPARAEVEFNLDQPSQPRISIDGNDLGAINRLLTEGSIVSTRGLDLSLAEGNAVSLSSKTREIIVKANTMPGWATRISPRNQAALRFHKEKTLVDVLTASKNTESVIMRFPDAGMAEMDLESAARFDYFKDQSYYVSGFGRVKAQSADGQVVFLSHQLPMSAPTPQVGTTERSITEAPRPPLVGGPLPPMTGAATAQLGRIDPTTDVLISGTLEESLSIKVADRTIELNAARPTESVTLPNGSSIEFTLNTAAKQLAWRVAKGYFTLGMDGEAFRLWRAIALTDQSATMQWSKMQIPPTIELKNTTPASPMGSHNIIMVDLAKGVPPYNRYFDAPQPGFYAKLKPNATFSYSPSQVTMEGASGLKHRVGASAPEGGVNIFRVFPGIASVAPEINEATFNKELLIGTECFCVEAPAGVGSTARGALGPVAGGPTPLSTGGNFSDGFRRPVRTRGIIPATPAGAP